MYTFYLPLKLLLSFSIIYSTKLSPTLARTFFNHSIQWSFWDYFLSFNHMDIWSSMTHTIYVGHMSMGIMPFMGILPQKKKNPYADIPSLCSESSSLLKRTHLLLWYQLPSPVTDEFQTNDLNWLSFFEFNTHTSKHLLVIEVKMESSTWHI